MIDGHGGNVEKAAAALGCAPEAIFDMSSNINPIGPLPGLMAHLRGNMEGICRLPEVSAAPAAAAYANWQGLPAEQVLAGAGTTQFLYQLPAALEIASALVVSPTYADYADALAINGVAWGHFMTRAENGFLPDPAALAESAKTVDAVFFCNPNNPTGVYTPIYELERLFRACPDTCFIVDESYLPFVSNAGDASIAQKGLSNVIVLHSLSKMFCIPGLRVGFCMAPPASAEKIRRRSPPWSVNALAQQAVVYITRDPAAAAGHAERTRAFLESARRDFMARMMPIPALSVFPGTATFMLFQLHESSAADLVAHLLAHRLLIRDCSNFAGLTRQFFRLSLKQPEENRLAAKLISDYLAGADA